MKRVSVDALISSYGFSTTIFTNFGVSSGLGTRLFFYPFGSTFILH